MNTKWIRNIGLGALATVACLGVSGTARADHHNRGHHHGCGPQVGQYNYGYRPIATQSYYGTNYGNYGNYGVGGYSSNYGDYNNFGGGYGVGGYPMQGSYGGGAWPVGGSYGGGAFLRGGAYGGGSSLYLGR